LKHYFVLGEKTLINQWLSGGGPGTY